MIRTASLFTVLISISASLLAQHHFESPNAWKLKGTFPLNETVHIASQAATDGQCPAQLTGPMSSSLFNDSGTWSFDGNGKMQTNDNGQYFLTYPATDASQIVGAKSQCNGTYTLSSESTVDMNYTCSQDGGKTLLKVHAVGKITPGMILVGVPNDASGNLHVNPISSGGKTVGCAYLGLNTIISTGENLR